MKRLFPVLALVACFTLTLPFASRADAKAKTNNKSSSKNNSGGSAQGWVQKRTDKTISIHTPDSQIAVQYMIRPDVQVTLNGRPAGLFDVLHGDNVTLTLSGRQVTKIDATR